MIVYVKSYPDGTTYYVEEVRVGRKERAVDSMYKRKNRLTDANGNETTQISDLSVPEELDNRHTTDKQSVETVEASQVAEQSDTQPTSSMNASTTSSEDKDSNIVESAIESEEKVEEIGDIPDDIWESSLDEDMPDFTNSASAYFPSEEMKQKFSTMRARINDWAQKLGVQVRIMETLDDVVNQSAREQILKGGKVYGYFDPATGEVTFYLPDFLSLHGRELTEKEFLSEIDKTYIHEVVAHRGLRGLLGEDKYGELCDMVWDAMTEQQKANFLNYPGVNGNSRIAADEFIAHFAEHVDYNDNRTLWDKIVDFIKDLLTFDNRIEISNEGLAEILRQSYARLARNATAINAKQQESSEAKPERISLDEYLGRLGLSSPISDYMDDKLRNPHGLSKNQREQLEKEAARAASEYQSRRSAAIEEYAQLVSNGSIIPPTRIDILVATANGHPDNAATQAARRSLEKRGYDWQTGQKKSTEVKYEPEKAFKTIKAEKAKDEKIEDFGEKIGGARKDVARAKIRDSVKLTTKDLVELKDPDKILSRKNIIKYYSEGAMTYEDAVKLLAMNMAVRGRDTIDRGVAMKKYRNLAMAWESGAELIVEITDEDVQDRMNEYSERMRQTPDFEKKTRESLELFVLKVYNDYKATYEALNYPEVYRNLKSAYIRYGDHDGKYWVVGGPNAYRGYPFPTLEQALAKMVKLYPEQAVAKKPAESKKDGEKSSSIHVTKDKAGYYRIKSRNIPGEIYLSGKLYSKKDAEAYLAENLDKLVERENRLLEALLGSNIGMVEREGLDYRKGKDVTPQDFLDTFGFRGVEFGNWVPQVERQAYLNKTYDAIMDFCRIVGISPKAFSLGGRLGLAFGSRGKSRALAHYEPLKEVINLTRMKGAGSLAHEWFHALDNYLAKQRSGNTSDMTTDNKPALRQEVTDAFNAFVSAMNRLAYTRRSNRAGQYWGEVWERAARLFESYIYNELGGQNIVSPLLVKKDTLYVDYGEFSDDAWPYPSAEENEQMKPYFDRLFSTLQEQVEEDGSVTLFRAEGAGRKQAQFDIINETNPMTDDYHVGIRKVEDIKTFDEVMEAARRESEEGGWPELASYPDIENFLLEDALETRRIVIYSSHPISNGTFVTPSYMQADEYSGMTGEVYSKEVSVDDIAWINTDEGQYASLNDATDRYDDMPDDDIRFRIISEQDAAYLKAVEAGDMETAQRMVIEAARLAGYDSNSDYQGSLAFNGAAPSGHAYYDTKEERIEAWENGNMEDDQTLGDYKDAGVDISNLGWNLTSPVARRMGNEYTRESIKNLADAINNDSRKIKIYRAVDANIKEDSIRNGDWVTPSRAYAEYHIELQDWKEGRIIEQEVDIDDIWWDGNDINEWGYNDGKGYAYKNTANNRKLIAPVTYDNNGNVIPLSERFNEEKDDIRFRTTEIIPEVREEMAEIKESAERNGTYLKAPNGADTNLTPEQWALVRTKAFKAWFGDWELPHKMIDVVRGSIAHSFANFDDARQWAKDNIVRVYSNEETNGKGEIEISNNAVKKYLSGSAVKKSDSKDIHLAVLKILPSVIRNGVIAETHADYMKDENGERTAESRINPDITIHRVYGAVRIGDDIYRVKVTLKEHRDENRPNSPHSYEATKIELLAGTLVGANGSNPNTNNSISTANLLKGVEKSYESGKYLLDDYSKVVDENGEPMVVYHETDWDALNEPNGEAVFKMGESDAFYFSNTPSRQGFEYGENLFEFFLNIRKPRILRTEYYVGRGVMSGRYWSIDGVINIFEDKIIFTTFSPSQIKSATDNTGEYSTEDKDIRYRVMSDVNTNPTEAQKKAGNYKMGHIRLDGYNITIENPKGSVRRGTDSKGNAWENTLNNDYGYIRGTEGVDGDHIDVYLSDNPTEGNVFVIDQVNPETREFDEHKVMYGFKSAEEAREAYLANFNEGWNGLGTITEVSKDEFKKWIESSHRKTKPFSEYKSVRANEMQTTDESDIRYRVVTNQETLGRLNSEPTIKVYRAMQLIDGKLYPPMSAKVDGELRQPIELGQWEEAEERPDLVDEKGRFKLDKGNKSRLKARYNPYFHTSPTPLNDQFSSAQTRPELVTVEVEVPESELTSGYKAEKAKDSVGKMEWKAGVVQSKLSGTRTVILSRWDKPVRIVPDSEVADVIVDMFEGRNITMPSNVVTPSLRAELERRGVPFVETDNQGNPVEEVSFRITGTPTDEVVANGLNLSPAQLASLAGNIFSALPEESRKKITDGLNGNILGLHDAILQIPASLAAKESWSDEDRAVAEVVAEQMTKMAGETPFHTWRSWAR